VRDGPYYIEEEKHVYPDHLSPFCTRNWLYIGMKWAWWDKLLFPLVIMGPTEGFLKKFLKQVYSWGSSALVSNKLWLLSCWTSRLFLESDRLLATYWNTLSKCGDLNFFFSWMYAKILKTSQKFLCWSRQPCFFCCEVTKIRHNKKTLVLPGPVQSTTGFLHCRLQNVKPTTSKGTGTTK
jgi:hypothetical protein